MWVARFQLKDDADIYSPLCVRHGVDFFAHPFTNYVKDKAVHLVLGGIIVGTEQAKQRFIASVKKDRRVLSLEMHKDFILMHTAHPLSRERKKEIRIFYNPQYLRLKPVHVSSDGWEYWEVACTDRQELNTLVQTAIKQYHGKLKSLSNEKIRSIASLSLSPALTERQLQALMLARREGYYAYPRRSTLPQLARMAKVSYATFQEHVSKAEGRLVSFFFDYR